MVRVVVFRRRSRLLPIYLEWRPIPLGCYRLRGTSVEPPIRVRVRVKARVKASFKARVKARVKASVKARVRIRVLCRTSLHATSCVLMFLMTRLQASSTAYYSKGSGLRLGLLSRLRLSVRFKLRLMAKTA